MGLRKNQFKLVHSTINFSKTFGNYFSIICTAPSVCVKQIHANSHSDLCSKNSAICNAAFVFEVKTDYNGGLTLSL